jgi:peptidoglycan/LPS O-acetylase OafA/YrhL
VPARVHFTGLNSLRFLAAFFVVLGHIPLNQASVGLPHPSWGTFFFRGAFAVCFFFALSGFLITYLLLDERSRTGAINVRKFYLRRVCRIWPLYFAVIGLGLFVYNALLPLLRVPYVVNYRLTTALLFYVALLPNLMNSLYNVGGILNPTWSIGVEEQFYLLWAPAVRWIGGRLPWVCCSVLLASLTCFCLSHYQVFGLREWKHFVEQLKFHYMAAGALCAWWLKEHPAAFLRLPIFRSRTAQVLLCAVLLDFYLTSFIHWNWIGEELLQLVLYCWLIVNVAANPVSILPIGGRFLDYLGTISYGIYMLHMPVVYATSEWFHLTSWWRGRGLPIYCVIFYSVAFGLTLLVAHLSYRYFERPFLRLKDRQFASGEGQSNFSAKNTPTPAPSAVVSG